MKKRDLEELKGKTEKELATLAARYAHELSVLRSEIALGREKNVKAGKIRRTQLARILTILNQKKQEPKVEATK